MIVFNLLLDSSKKNLLSHVRLNIFEGERLLAWRDSRSSRAISPCWRIQKHTAAAEILATSVVIVLYLVIMAHVLSL